jgi:hypothetical protein
VKGPREKLASCAEGRNETLSLWKTWSINACVCDHLVVVLGIIIQELELKVSLARVLRIVIGEKVAVIIPMQVLPINLIVSVGKKKVIDGI